MKNKPPKTAILTSATFRSLQDTIKIYDDSSFAEMFFEKWKDDVPGLQLETFSRLVGLGGKVLDAGCGPGHHSNYLNKLGHDMVGIDLSSAALKIAKGNFTKPEFLKLNTLETPFTTSEFSGIWSCASLMHLPQSLLPLQLKEFHRVLAQGGILGLTVSVESQSHSDSFGRFFESYPSKHLDQQLVKNGFELITHDTRHIPKTTEQNGRTGEWLTIIARKIL